MNKTPSSAAIVLAFSLFAVIAAGLGVLVFAVNSRNSAINEIEGLILFLIAAVLFGFAAVVRTLDRNAKESA